MNAAVKHKQQLSRSPSLSPDDAAAMADEIAFAAVELFRQREWSTLNDLGECLADAFRRAEGAAERRDLAQQHHDAEDGPAAEWYWAGR